MVGTRQLLQGWVNQGLSWGVMPADDAWVFLSGSGAGCTHSGGDGLEGLCPFGSAGLLFLESAFKAVGLALQACTYYNCFYTYPFYTLSLFILSGIILYNPFLSLFRSSLVCYIF